MPKPSKLPLHPAPSPSETSPEVAPSVSSTPSSAEPRSKPRSKRKSRSKPARRQFTAAEKLRIVREADACSGRGEVEALLRREGIYSSHLAAWRKALRLYGEKGVPSRGPGRPRTRDAQSGQIAALERENVALRRDIERLRAVVEVQKKLSSLLGLTIEDDAR